MTSAAIPNVTFRIEPSEELGGAGYYLEFLSAIQQKHAIVLGDIELGNSPGNTFQDQ